MTLLTMGTAPRAPAVSSSCCTPPASRCWWTSGPRRAAGRNPDMSRAAMAGWLPAGGVAYRWEPRLGGWRRDPPDSPDTALRNRAFAGYAAHMRTPEFGVAVDELLAAAQETCTAVLCSEGVWWRRHRRMIADFAALVRGVPVEHLMHDGRRPAHTPTDGVRLLADGLLVYDGGQPPCPTSDDRHSGTPGGPAHVSPGRACERNGRLACAPPYHGPLLRPPGE